MTRKEAADARQKATGMRQSNGAMIAKLAFGFLFFVSGLTTDWKSQPGVENPVFSMVFSVILGLALIAWGLIPYLNARKLRAEAAAKKEAALRAAEEQRMNTLKICPACGARTKGDRCEYCDTPLN